MITQKQITERYTDRIYEVTGDNINEIIDFCIPKIRPQSQENYRTYIREDLLEKGVSLIDVHAGMGWSYRLKLKS
jgi:hypothetical protein